VKITQVQKKAIRELRDNQVDIDDQNIQQIRQNPVSQPLITPEKPKINYMKQAVLFGLMFFSSFLIVAGIEGILIGYFAFFPLIFSLLGLILIVWIYKRIQAKPVVKITFLILTFIFWVYFFFSTSQVSIRVIKK